MWQAREAFEKVFNRGWEHLHMGLVYDVAHNIAKFEEHEVGGSEEEALGPPQGRDAGLSRRAIPKCRRCIAASASR